MGFKMDMTSKDVLAEWKQKRFVISDQILHDCPGRLIVLTDLSFWSEHAEDLGVWCCQHGARVAGVTVEIPNDAVLTMFVLRWS